MTRERIAEILVKRHRYEAVGRDGDLMNAIADVVNEAIQECMDAAYENVVDVPIIHEIRNLKVK